MGRKWKGCLWVMEGGKGGFGWIAGRRVDFERFREGFGEWDLLEIRMEERSFLIGGRKPAIFIFCK
jgi:hypothetical protein